MTYIPPSITLGKFTCPHCGAIALQRWQHSSWKFGSVFGDDTRNVLRIATCDHCNLHSLWHEDVMLYPDNGNAPPPNSELPPSVKTIYLEAASISTKSPRGAAGLLRLALQILCKELGEKGDNINADIASLVKKGLPERVQQALDVVRVTGNNAVHPGQIVFDSPEIVGNLFTLINVIAEYMISMPKRISNLYSQLPEKVHEQIAKRDETSQ